MTTINKIFNRLILLALGITLLSSCEDFAWGDASLQKPEGSDVDLEYIFSSKLYAERVLVSAYKTLPYGIITSATGYEQKVGSSMLDCITDLMGGGEATLYYKGAINAGVESNSPATKYSFTKEGSWDGIRSAYIFIENVHKVPDMTPEEKKIRIAEAKMVIAVHYTDMFRHFGGMPWLDHAVYPNEDTYFPRLTAEETVNKICDLLDQAAKDLPWAFTPEQVQTEDGRFHKAAALGQKVRLLLFAASPLFNDDEPYLGGAAADQKVTWFGGKSDIWWQRAETACEDFFKLMDENPGSYGLVNTGDSRNDYIRGYNSRGTGETLISTRKVYQTGGLWSPYYIYQGATKYRDFRITQELVDMYDKLDGTPFSWDNPEDAASPFFDAKGNPLRDARLYENVVIEGDYMPTASPLAIETWVGRTNRNIKGWFRQANETSLLPQCQVLRKYVRERTAGNGFAEVVHFPYLRLPEIMLSYAEILNELGRRDEAFKYVEPIRERAGVTDDLSKRTWTKDSFREFVLKERACELFLEDNRWFDIVRYKRDDIFKKRLHGLEFVSETEDGKNITIDRIELSPDRYWRLNFSPKWYLSAIPSSEINKKYGLIQNPGWE